MEEENQRLQDFHCNMEKDPDIRIASSIEDGNQRLIEEINAIDSLGMYFLIASWLDMR